MFSKVGGRKGDLKGEAKRNGMVYYCIRRKKEKWEFLLAQESSLFHETTPGP